MPKAFALIVCVAVVTACLPALGDGASDALEAGRALCAQGKFADAEGQLRAAMALWQEKGLENLGASELAGLADAHKLLMAAAYARLLQQPDLPAQLAKEAAQWRDMALGVQDIRVVGHGEPVDIAKYLVPGKTTIVDFFSIYCGPCVSLGVFIDALAEKREDLMLLKVDINRPGVKGIDWSSPTAQQFELKSIPHLRVYGPDGQLQLEGQEARDKVLEWLSQENIR